MRKAKKAVNFWNSLSANPDLPKENDGRAFGEAPPPLVISTEEFKMLSFPILLDHLDLLLDLIDDGSRQWRIVQIGSHSLAFGQVPFQEILDGRTLFGVGVTAIDQ